MHISRTYFTRNKESFENSLKIYFSKAKNLKVTLNVSCLNLISLLKKKKRPRRMNCLKYFSSFLLLTTLLFTLLWLYYNVSTLF